MVHKARPKRHRPVVPKAQRGRSHTVPRMVSSITPIRRIKLTPVIKRVRPTKFIKKKR